MRYTYIYDTYCGWCYGASPIISALIDSEADVRALHRRLFYGSNTHRMGDGFGRAARVYDHKIETLTGQRFSAVYVQQVLDDPDEILTSAATACAAALVHDKGAKVEMALARALQQARFIEGRSALDDEHVQTVLRGFGVDAPLAQGAAKARSIQSEASDLMHRFGVSGVPTLLQHDGHKVRVIDLSKHYATPKSIAANAA